MQTSFHIDGLDFPRVPDVSGQSSEAPRYSASGESLEALKARTTPIDITNPYTSAHASCANAFIATAISIEHRFDEIHLQLPADVKASVAVASLINHQKMGEINVEEISQPTLQPTIEFDAEPQWDFDMLSGSFIAPQADLWRQQHHEPMISEDISTMFGHDINEPQQLQQIEFTSSVINEVTIVREYQQDEDGITFAGEAPAGSMLHFYLDDVLVGSSESDSEGHWQFDLPASLPATQHIFSAVPVSPTGVMGYKVDFSFIIESKLGAILMPIDETAFEKNDLELIELVTSPEETPVTLLPPVLTEEKLEGWRTHDGISVFEPIHHPDVFVINELEHANIY